VLYQHLERSQFGVLYENPHACQYPAEYFDKEYSSSKIV